MLLSRTLLKRHSVLPGFDLALGFTLLYLSFIVLVPLSAAFLKTFTMTWPAFWGAVSAPRVVASYRLTFGASFAAALVNACFGLVVCWVLVRYDFFGKRFVDALVDLPFALPTAVAGIALTALYSGQRLDRPLAAVQGRASRRSASGSRSPSSACPSSCARCSRCSRTCSQDVEEAAADPRRDARCRPSRA